MSDPTTPPHLKANVNWSSSGFEKIKSEADTLVAAIGSAGIEFAKTGSISSSVLSGMKAGIITKVLGPFALVTGAMMGIHRGLKNIVHQTNLWATGLRQVKSIEFLERQFEPLLRGAGAARKRMQELYQFAATTPFKLGEVAEASRVLEVLTRGAISTGRGLRMIGDMAAVSGREFESVAFWVGRLYDGLQSGKPIGEVTFRLQEMGLIAGNTRNEIERLQAAGADFGTVWKSVTKDFERTAGGMERLSQTLAGLESTLSDVKDQFAAGYSRNFLEAEKNSARATIAVLEQMQPAIEDMGRMFAMVAGPISSVKKWLAETGVVAGAVAPAFKLLVLIMSSLFGPVLFAQLLVMKKGLSDIAKMAWKLAEGATGIKVVNRAMEVGGAKAKMLGWAAKGLVAVLGLVKAAAKAAWASLVATGPVGLAVAGLALLGSIVSEVASRMAASAEKWQELKQVSQDAVTAHRQEQAAIQTLDQYYSFLTATIEKLIAARKELNSLTDPEQRKFKEDEIRAYERSIREEKRRDVGKLAPGAAARDERLARMRGERKLRDMEWQGRFQRAGDFDREFMLAERVRQATEEDQDAQTRQKDFAGMQEWTEKMAKARAELAEANGKKTPGGYGAWHAKQVALNAITDLEDRKPQNETTRLYQAAEDARKQGDYATVTMLEDRIQIMREQDADARRRLIQAKEDERNYQSSMSRSRDELKAELSAERELLRVRGEGIAQEIRRAEIAKTRAEAEMDVARRLGDQLTESRKILEVEQQTERIRQLGIEASRNRAREDVNQRAFLMRQRGDTGGADSLMRKQSREDAYIESLRSGYASTGNLGLAIQSANREFAQSDDFFASDKERLLAKVAMAGEGDARNRAFDALRKSGWKSDWVGLGSQIDDAVSQGRKLVAAQALAGGGGGIPLGMEEAFGRFKQDITPGSTAARGPKGPAPNATMAPVVTAIHTLGGHLEITNRLLAGKFRAQ